MFSLPQVWLENGCAVSKNIDKFSYYFLRKKNKRKKRNFPKQLSRFNYGCSSYFMLLFAEHVKIEIRLETSAFKRNYNLNLFYCSKKKKKTKRKLVNKFGEIEKENCLKKSALKRRKILNKL